MPLDESQPPGGRAPRGGRRRIFLDLGALDGSSTRFFQAHHPQASGFSYYGFECLPANLEALRRQPLPFTLIPQAAWTHDGAVRFHPGNPDGSSVYGNKITGRVRADVFIEVPCLDFAEFLRPLIDAGDEIQIKMNIEGAEYPLIEHLQAAGLIPGVARWYMAWHAHKIGMAKKEHERIAAMLPGWFPWPPPHKPGSIEAFRASLEPLPGPSRAP